MASAESIPPSSRFPLLTSTKQAFDNLTLKEKVQTIALTALTALAALSLSLVIQTPVAVALSATSAILLSCMVFCAATHFFQRQASASTSSAISPDNPASLLDILMNNSLPTDANFRLIQEHPDRESIETILTLLDGAELLTQDRLQTAASHPAPQKLEEAMYRLSVAGILDENSFGKLRKETMEAIHELPQDLCTAETLTFLLENRQAKIYPQIIALLDAENLLDQLKDEKQIQKNDLLTLFVLLIFLKEAELLTSETLEASTKRSSLFNVRFALNELQQKELLQRETLLLVLEGENPEDGLNCLLVLNEQNLLSDENRSALRSEMSRHLLFLKQKELLTQDNFEALTKNPNFAELYDMFHLLDDEGILTQETLSPLLKLTDPHKATNAFLQLQYEENLDAPMIAVVFTHLDNPALQAALYSAGFYLKTFQKSGVTKEQLEKAALHKMQDEIAYLLKKLPPQQYDCILDHPDPLSLFDATSFLEDKELLTEERFPRLANHSQLKAITEILSLIGEECVSQITFEAVIDLESPETYLPLFQSISGIMPITDKVFFALIHIKNPTEIHEFAEILKEAKLLNDDVYLNLLEEKGEGSLMQILQVLKEEEIAEKELLAPLVRHPSHPTLAELTARLIEADLFDKEHFALLVNHENFYPLGACMEPLIQSELLNATTFPLLVQQNDLDHLAELIAFLSEAALLQKIDLPELLKHPQILGIHKVLEVLHRNQLVTLANYQAILPHKFPGLGLFQAVIQLDQNKRLDQESFTEVANSKTPAKKVKDLMG